MTWPLLTAEWLRIAHVHGVVGMAEWLQAVMACVRGERE